MKIYIVHPRYDYAVEEVFTERHLAEEYKQGLEEPEQYYIEQRDLLDYVPKGGDRYERFYKEQE